MKEKFSRDKSSRKWNVFDLFLIILVLLAGSAVYFTFIKPIEFSQLIQREGVNRYAQVEMLLSDDLGWMKETLPREATSSDAYGTIDWTVLEVGEESLGGRDYPKVTAKLKVVEEPSGLIRYGKYTLVQGGMIRLINDHYFVEGRVLRYKMLDETQLL